MKRSVSLALALISLLGLVLAAAPQRPQSSRPDVVLIVLDALRRDHLSLYGYQRRTTPSLDARRGKMRVFTNAVTPAPQTAPAIASLFTGLPPRTHGVQFDSVNHVFGNSAVPTLVPTVETMAWRFKSAGYATAGITSNPWIGAEWGFAAGFDTFVGWKTVDPQLPNDGRRVLTHLDTWLRSAPQGPRFIYAHFMDTHAPYEKGRTTFVGRKGTEVVFNGKKTVPPEDLQYMIDLYDSDIVYVDSLLAELLGAMDKSGRPWIAAIVADHGDEFLEHGGIGHGTSLYEEQLQVPVMFTGSRLGRVGTSDYPLMLTDVHDMLLAAAGLRRTPLAGLISSNVPEPPAAPDRLLTSEFYTSAALRRGNWKYIVRKEPFAEELFDLRGDPGERTNRIAARVEDHPLRTAAAGLWPGLFIGAP